MGDVLGAYQRRKEFVRVLAAADPSNAGWQHDLGISNERIGDVLMAQGRLDDALAAYQQKQDIIARLAAADPSNAGWQRDLAWSHWRLAKVGDQPRIHWQEVVRILRGLEAEGRLAPTDRKWLPIAEQNLAASD